MAKSTNPRRPNLPERYRFPYLETAGPHNEPLFGRKGQQQYFRERVRQEGGMRHPHHVTRRIECRQREVAILRASFRPISQAEVDTFYSMVLRWNDLSFETPMEPATREEYERVTAWLQQHRVYPPLVFPFLAPNQPGVVLNRHCDSIPIEGLRN